MRTSTVQRKRICNAYDEHLEAVRCKLESLGVAQSEIPDLVQNAFGVAVRRADVFPEESVIAKVWLLRVARKLAGNHHRSRRYKAQIFEEVDDEELAEAPADPLEPEACIAVRQIVRLALESLDIQDREVLVEHYLYGHTYEQIAQCLGICRSSVQHRAQAARERFVEAFLRLSVVDAEVPG